MESLTKRSENVMELLLKADEDQLYEQLGMRAKAITLDPSIGSSFDPTVRYDGETMGLKEDIQEFGKRLFNRWNKEAYKLICGSDSADIHDREELLDAFGIGEVAVAGALAALLISQFVIAPAVATIIAALVVKRFFKPAHAEFCAFWEQHLPKE